jgi:hypothetical protein
MGSPRLPSFLFSCDLYYFSREKKNPLKCFGMKPCRSKLATLVACQLEKECLPMDEYRMTHVF